MYLPCFQYRISVYRKIDIFWFDKPFFFFLNISVSPCWKVIANSHFYYGNVETSICYAIQVAPPKSRTHQLRSSYLINFHRKRVSVTCSVKFPGMEYFDEPNNLVSVLNYSREKLQTFIPGSVKQFPWKKAKSLAQNGLLVLGKETLKWSLLGYFAFNCLSDIIYSISRNRELVIPLGLFVGVLMTKFLDEISRELLSDDKVSIGSTH